MNNWVDEWNAPPQAIAGTLQAIEVTPAKQVVWALDSWTDPVRLGSATTIQFLDQPTAAEDVHFGEFR
jgi:hypothetical protein